MRSLWGFLDKADQLIQTDIYYQCKFFTIAVVIIATIGGILMVNYHESSVLLKSPKLIFTVCMIAIVAMGLFMYGLFICYS